MSSKNGKQFHLFKAVVLLGYFTTSLAFCQVQDRWFSPSGTGSGLTSNAPVRFTNYEINLMLYDATLTNVTFHFLPGDYMVGGTNKGNSDTSDAIYIQGNTNKIV